MIFKLSELLGKARDTVKITEIEFSTALEGQENKDRMFLCTTAVK